jgi:8-oxo-dGTP diphosphatase
MSEAKYCYDYPRPAVTADVVVMAGEKLEILKLLLIKRKHPPFQGMWALPGGFAEMDEDIETTAIRELKEETGLKNVAMHQIGAFGKVGRDSRHRTVTVAYLSMLRDETVVEGRDDASEARWLPMDDLPPLAFDHADIIDRGLELWKSMRSL